MRVHRRGIRRDLLRERARRDDCQHGDSMKTFDHHQLSVSR